MLDRLDLLTLAVLLGSCSTAVEPDPSPLLPASSGVLASPSPSDFRTSPTGEPIAYIRQVGSRTELRVVQPDAAPDRRVAGPIDDGPADVCLSDSMWVAGNTAIEWAPNGRALVFTTGVACPTMYVVNVDGSGLRELTEGREPTWSPQGDEIAFLAEDEAGDCPGVCGRIAVIDVASGAVDEVPSQGAERLSDVSWSPDGGKLVFTAFPIPGPDTTPTVEILDLATGERETIAEGTQPAWSPDGRFLAYSRWEGESGSREQRVFVRSVSGGDETQIGVGLGPEWSPDGDLVAFVKLRVSYDTGIAVAPPDGSFVRELASDALGQAVEGFASVDWSPTGEHVVFSMFNRERSADVVFVVSAEGGEPVPIAEGLRPAWQPLPEG